MPFNREVLRLRGSISRDMPWEVMPDLFFYRDPEEAARAEEVVDRTICIYNFPPLPFQVIASKQADFDAPPAKEEWGGEELASAAAQVQRLGVFQLRELLRAKRRSARLGCFWRVFPRLGERPPLQVPRRKFRGIYRYPSVPIGYLCALRPHLGVVIL